MSSIKRLNIPAVQSRWRRELSKAFQHATSTKKVSHAKAESAINESCEEFGVAPPRRFEWFPSPIAAALKLQNAESDTYQPFGSPLIWRIWTSPACDARHLLSSILNNPRKGIVPELLEILGPRPHNRVATLMRLLMEAISRTPNLCRACYAMQEADVVAGLRFLREIAEPGSVPRFDGMAKVVQNAGWFWPYSNCCLVSERPIILELDERSRLHCVDGPAYKFADGHSVFAWHGVRVPQKIIEARQHMTVSMIVAESNAEVRRVMMEQYGMERFLHDANARVLHRDDWGALYQLHSNREEPLTLVKVVNATAEPDGAFKDYFLRVPPAMRTAHEAVAWTFGLSDTEYQPQVET